MARLVEHRAQIGIAPHGVHEDKRQPALGERRLVAAGGLALATLKIKEIELGHASELRAQLAVESREDLLAAGDEFLELSGRGAAAAAPAGLPRDPTGAIQ
jgi:hypothetical protein